MVHWALLFHLQLCYCTFHQSYGLRTFCFNLMEGNSLVTSGWVCMLFIFVVIKVKLYMPFPLSLLSLVEIFCGSYKQHKTP